MIPEKGTPSLIMSIEVNKDLTFLKDSRENTEYTSTKPLCFLADSLSIPLGVFKVGKHLDEKMVVGTYRPVSS